MHLSGRQLRRFGLPIQVAQQLGCSGGVISVTDQNEVATPIMNLDIQAMFNLL